MSIEIRNVWTRDQYFALPNLESRGDPTTVTVGVGNQYRSSAVDTCGVMNIAQRQMNRPRPATIVTVKNTKYKNMSQADSNKKMMRSAQLHLSVAKLNKNPVFSAPSDGEKENATAYAALEKENPEFILSKTNKTEIEQALADPNSIAKPWVTDAGTGLFDYQSPESNNVKMVIDANAAYVQRRDRFFVKPQEGVAAQKQLELARSQEADYQTALTAYFSKARSSGGKSTRRRR